MKKIFIVFFLVIAITLTGCGNTKTLSCKMESDGNKSEETFTYSKNKLTKINSTIIYSASDETISEEDLETMKSILEYVCSAYTNIDGIKCETEATTKRVALSLSVDIAKVDAKTLEEFAYDEKAVTEFTYDELKASLIEGGYTCK